MITRRELVGGDVLLESGEMARVRGINSDGIARVTIHGLFGLDAIRDVEQSSLTSIRHSEFCSCPWFDGGKFSRDCSVVAHAKMAREQERVA